ncbi:MAG: ABC transporter ATP-binding protein [Planctomycetaceae bacterium]|nr:ABC transporter ATP-binding protein [Planctomycetaceae bacterium]
MIEIQAITRVHHRGDTEVPALRGVTCSIPEGRFTFIVGPSGSGKSSLLYLIGALDQPSGGDIVVAGRSLAGMSASQRDEYRRNEVGFIFQSFNLLRNLDCVDNVLVPWLPGGVSPARRAEACQMLGRVGLTDRLSHRPGQLSGGEQQRVAIARALLKQPRLVLADEPTGELDSRTGAEIFGWLRELHRDQGTTVVVVTHDLSYIEPGDNIIRLRDGLVIDGGTEYTGGPLTADGVPATAD